jgi:hypothetical protein
MRGFARIHVQHDDPRLTPPVHSPDPLAPQIGEGSEVLRPRLPRGLEAAHLAGEAPLPIGALPPTTQRIAGSRHSRSPARDDVLSLNAAGSGRAVAECGHIACTGRHRRNAKKADHRHRWLLRAE